MTFRRERELERSNRRLLMGNIMFAAVLAVLIPTAIIFQHWRYIPLVAAAEDDCPFYYGAYKLSDVYGIEIDGRHAVECRYR